MTLKPALCSACSRRPVQCCHQR